MNTNEKVTLYIEEDMPELGYIQVTASKWLDIHRYIVAKGVARNRVKATAFALEALANKMKGALSDGNI
jgi:hypothetical protein